LDCVDRDRLFKEYFDALEEQQKINAHLKAIMESGNAQLIAVAQTQVNASIEECYEAWHALNDHQFTHRCGPV